MPESPFGWVYKYASKPNGESYSLPSNPNADNRFDAEQEVISNGDGTYRFTDDDKVEFSIFTSALFNPDSIIDDHGDLDPDQGGRGYMMNIKDWRDVEVDIQWRVNNRVSSNDGWYLYLGGGRHSTPQPFCEGSSYVVKWFYNGDLQILKEQWHNNKVPVPFEDTYEVVIPGTDYSNGILKGALVGDLTDWYLLKIVRYNIKNNDGTSAVKIEVYNSDTGDGKTWILLTSVLDTAEWGKDGDECGGRKDQVLNWGFPSVRFQWKNAERIDWKGINIREILPQGPVAEDPDDGGGDGGTGNGGGGGGQPTIPPAEQPTGKVEKIGSFRFSIASTLANSCDGLEPTQPPQDPNPPPPDGTPPGGAGTISFKHAEYFKVGS